MHLRAVTLLLAAKVLIVLRCQRCGAIGVTRVTNFKCTSFDKSYANFRKCDLKVIGRGVVALNTEIELLQAVTHNVSINLALYKKASGYRPFLYNYTHDFCSIMAKPNRQPFMKILLDVLKNYSNLNHSCPYNPNTIIFVKDFVLKQEHFRLIPVPTGDYLVSMNFAAYNELKANSQIYITRTEQDWIN